MKKNQKRLVFSAPALMMIAGLALQCASFPVSGAEIVPDPLLPSAPYALRDPVGRLPVRAFTTANGVYELDSRTKTVRAWPRSAEAGEVAESRLNGLDSAKGGSPFSAPVAMAKKPGENLIAVLDAARYLPSMADAPKPRVAFYSFTESTTNGLLSAAKWTLKGEIVSPVFANATDVSFFPSGNKVAVSIARYSSSATDGDQGAVQIWSGPGATSPDASFLVVRDKDLYELSPTGIGSEPYDVPITAVYVDPVDSKGIYVGSDNLNVVLRYDPVSGTEYSETVTLRTLEYNLFDGVQYVYQYFDAAVADFVQGQIGVAGCTNRLMSAPSGFVVWKSPSDGKLLVVADTENDRIAAFDENGNLRVSLGGSGRTPGLLENPRSVWISEDNSEIVVADSGNGRVQVFPITSGMFAPDESFTVEGPVDLYWESDTDVVSNKIVVAAASLTNRTYAVSVSTSPAGKATVSSSSVVIPAGETEGYFALTPLDGVAGGTTGKLSVAGLSYDFVITNVAPSLKTGPKVETADVNGQSYFYADEGALTSASMSVAVNYILLKDPKVLHFHAKAFDVNADSDLTYTWRVVGTPNNLGKIAGSMIEPELPNPVIKTTTYYYYTYTEGVPASTKTRTFTEAEVASFPKDSAGNYLYIEKGSSQISSEASVVTNVLSVGTSEVPLSSRKMMDWAEFLLLDEQGAAFLDVDQELSGADVEFTLPRDDLIYFAMLTVTDKDGDSVCSLTAADKAYFCAVAKKPKDVIPDTEAVYAAVFTAISETDLAFDVSVVSGTPNATDTVTLQSATALDGEWTKVETITVGADLESASSLSIERPIDNSAEVKFFRVVQP